MSNYQSIIQNQLLRAASGTFTFDIDTCNYNGTPITVSFTCHYPSTGTAGVMMQITDACGNTVANEVGGMPFVLGGAVGPTYESVPDVYYLTTPASVGLTTVTDSVEIICYILPRWIRITLTNLDPTLDITFNVIGDIP